MKKILLSLSLLASVAAQGKIFISPYLGASIGSIKLEESNFKSKTDGFKPLYGIKLGASLPLGLMFGIGYDKQQMAFKTNPAQLGLPAGSEMTFDFGNPFHTFYAHASYRLGLGLIAITPTVMAGGFSASSKEELPDRIGMGKGSGSVIGGGAALEVGIKRLSVFGEVTVRQYSGNYKQDGASGKVSITNVPLALGVRLGL